MNEDEIKKIAHLIGEMREMKATLGNGYEKFVDDLKEEAFHELQFSPHEVQALLDILEVLRLE